MSELHEVVTWLVYAMAAVVMLASAAAAVAFGLTLRFVAEFLLELNDGREADGARQEVDGEPKTPARARGSS